MSGWFRALALLSVTNLLLACGGGGSSGPSATATPTPLPTSASVSPTATPTITPTATATPTATPTSTPTNTATPTPTLTVSPTPTPTATSDVTPTATPTPTPTPDSSQVTISGLVTYDFVPNNSSNGGLDYDLMEARPVRGARVLAQLNNGTTVAQSETDAAGQYALSVDRNARVRIVVEAAMQRSGTPSWDIRVTDNTSGNALYTMAGSLAFAGTTDSERDLHASSGWNGSSYSTTRVAAPFAILDSVYEGLQQVLQADPDVTLEATELRWSINNTPVNGDRVSGQIGTSFYDPNEKNMYILGAANNDTDEYDRSVIIHEWGHYLEDTLSRSDSIGGNHSLSSQLDLRTAFSEGFANAFAGIASGQPFYADSAFTSQSSGFRFSLLDNNFGNSGWFSENSVGKIVYKIADTNQHSPDSLALGFTPIYRALTGTRYVSSDALTSIYVFIDALEAISDDNTWADIDTLVSSEGIHGRGMFGEGETNDSPSNLSYVLPVYHPMTAGQTVNVCGNNTLGEYNSLDNRRFIRLQISSSRNYTFTATKTVGTGNRDPDMFVFRRGVTVTGGALESGASNSETGSVALSSGTYVVEVFDYLNVDSEAGGGSSCFNVTVN